MCTDPRRLPRGIPAASLKAGPVARRGTTSTKSSAGNTRGLIEATRSATGRERRSGSSAGNTRGLIEASTPPPGPARADTSSAGNTRGLIEAHARTGSPRWPSRSSAGNTRGLIEALGRRRSRTRNGRSSAGNTRGLIEAWRELNCGGGGGGGLPRGIPAASLKLVGRLTSCLRSLVFRGEYPRPH